MGIERFVVVGNCFGEGKGVTCGEENLFLTFLFFAGLFTSFVTFAVLVHILKTCFFLLITYAGLKGVFVFFVVALIFLARLINLDADEGECIFDSAVATHNFAVDDALVNLGEQFGVLVNFDASAPLVSNTEEHFLELTV